jgi:hypothetical protein
MFFVYGQQTKLQNNKQNYTFLFRNLTWAMRGNISLFRIIPPLVISISSYVIIFKVTHTLPKKGETNNSAMFILSL